MIIWLIDDDPIQALLVATMCKQISAHIDFCAFEKVETALQQLETDNPPELILLDLSLPGLNGFDFLKLYSEKAYPQKWPDLNIYILSSSDLSEDRERSLSYPMVAGYLLKPLRLPQLQELLAVLAAPNTLSL